MIASINCSGFANKVFSPTYSLTWLASSSVGQIPSKDSIIEWVNIFRSTYKRALANSEGGILILPKTISIFLALSGPIIDTF